MGWGGGGEGRARVSKCGGENKKVGNQTFLKKLEGGTYLGGHCVIDQKFTFLKYFSGKGVMTAISKKRKQLFIP